MKTVAPHVAVPLSVNPAELRSRYFTVETFTRSAYVLTQLFFAAMLLFVVILAALMCRLQMDCYQFGDLSAEGSCAVDETSLPNYFDSEVYSVALNTGGLVLRSRGGVPDSLNSVFSKYPRFSIVLGAQLLNGTLDWTNTPYTLQTLTPQLSMVDEAGKSLGDIGDLIVREAEYQPTFAHSTQQVFVELPRSAVSHYASGTKGFVLKFDEPLVTGTMEAGWSPVVSIRFFLRKESYGHFELVFRTVALVGGVVAAYVFLSGWLHDEQGLMHNIRKHGLLPTVVFLTKGIFALPSFARGILWYHLAVTLFCDPLYAGSALLPRSGFFEFWRAHFLWNLMNAAAIMYITFISQRCRLNLFAVFGAGVVVALTATDLSSLGSSDTKSGRPSSLVNNSDARAIVYFCILCTWALVTLGAMRYKRPRLMMWKQPLQRYVGLHRVLVMWLLMMMPMVVITIIIWFAVLVPILGAASWLAPLYADSGVLWITLWYLLSGLGMWMFSQREHNAANVPQNPHDVQLGSHLQKQIAKEKPANERSLLVLSNEDGGQLLESWSTRQWSPEHFAAIRRLRIGGFFFRTEEEKMEFDTRNQFVPQKQSFFCWETAMSCLNLSNEVYLEHEDAGAVVMMEHSDPCCVTCVTECCLPNGDAPFCGSADLDVIDGVDEDDGFVHVERRPAESNSPPPSPSASDSSAPSSPGTGKIDVSQHGYRLHKVVVAHGVQAMICYIQNELESPKTPMPSGMRQQTNTSSNRIPQIVIAFRGTCSVSNAVTDIKIGRSVWDESMPHSNGRAKVHSGFALAWNDLRPLIDEHLGTLLQSGEVSPNAAFLSTGHSLGGAIATLCAYSLRKGWLAHHTQSVEVGCYTFGCPRVGNTSFQLHFDHVCRETYRVVNENDRVAYIGHCGRTHSGRMVAVNRDGNYCIEPSMLEQLLDPLYGGGSSLKNHLLTRYANSMDGAIGPNGLDQSKLFCSVYRMAEELRQMRLSQQRSTK